MSPRRSLVQEIVSNRLDRHLIMSSSIYHHNALHALCLIEGSELGERSHHVQRHSGWFDMPERELRRIDIDLTSVKEDTIPRRRVNALGGDENLRRAIRDRHAGSCVFAGA